MYIKFYFSVVDKLVQANRYENNIPYLNARK